MKLTYYGLCPGGEVGGLGDEGCQSKASRGVEYRGEENRTGDGRACLVWSETGHWVLEGNPEVGDHSYCRNPGGVAEAVWCLTSSAPNSSKPDGFGYCSVPMFYQCPPVEVLDFSADIDGAPDSTGAQTHAALEKEGMPGNFTLCTAFMVDAWNSLSGGTNSRLFLLKRSGGVTWITLDIFAASDATVFTIFVDKIAKFDVAKSVPLFPLSWVRACVSLDGDSTIRLVVDGQLLEERRSLHHGQIWLCGCWGLGS